MATGTPIPRSSLGVVEDVEGNQQPFMIPRGSADNWYASDVFKANVLAAKTSGYPAEDSDQFAGWTWEDKSISSFVILIPLIIYLLYAMIKVILVMHKIDTYDKAIRKAKRMTDTRSNAVKPGGKMSARRSDKQAKQKST